MKSIHIYIYYLDYGYKLVQNMQRKIQTRGVERSSQTPNPLNYFLYKKEYEHNK